MSLIHEVLQNTFGFQEFRPGQLEAIQALFDEKRILCIQPTGHGKSLLYQLPACLLDGITLVISPLLALMRDQVGQLNNRFHIACGSINTDQTDEENLLAKQVASEGKLRILFISPEQLNHVDRFEFLQKLPISLLVIDEAHCISTWGHDFRPSYRLILEFVQALEQKNTLFRILALTATADSHVAEDIIKQLSSAQAPVRVLRESMDRPNIHLSVWKAPRLAAKIYACEKLLADFSGTGLIYCATRENTELLAEYLKLKNINAIAYHAGLDPEEKRRIQEAFLNDSYKVVVATTALGMGIDKQNLRFIIHFDIPGSITAYYQEVGRCGRDGLKAEGVLLYDPADRKIQEHFIESALPSPENFENVFLAVKEAEEPPSLSIIKRKTGLHPTRVMIVLAELIEQQILKKASSKGLQVYRPLVDAISLDLSRYTNQHQIRKQELNKMIEYAEGDHCRMALLREALGDQNPKECGRCDACLNRESPSLPSSFTKIEQWLQDRPIPISGSKTYQITEGCSILDGKLHSPLFIHFMKQRTVAEDIDPELYALLVKQAAALVQNHAIAAIIPLPSRTWKAKNQIALNLGKQLGIPVLLDVLSWETVPANRQGELLNNDQRQHNVHQHMLAHFDQPVPKGAVLLFDDYIGSGASIKEAARALRGQLDSAIVPLTIAAIKWHLGKPGFI